MLVARAAGNIAKALSGDCHAGEGRDHEKCGERFTQDDDRRLIGMISEGDFLRRSELGTAKPGGSWIAGLLLPGQAAETTPTFMGGAYKLARAARDA